MGMIQYYLRVDQDTLDNFIEDSTILEDIAFEGDESGNYSILDVDKSWEGIFYLVTGSGLADAIVNESPQLGLLIGPSEIDPDQDMGYGPATFTNIEQTRDIYNSIKDLSKEELAARYNPVEMTEQAVYPAIWDDNDALEYLLDFFEDLKDFYKKAVENNQAMVMYLS